MSFVRPPVVFSSEPRKTTSFASLPRAIFDVFIAFMDFMAFIAFIAAML